MSAAPGETFAAWLAGMQRAVRGEADADVPCGGCTACCTSSQFVTIDSDERDALDHIPRPLLFPAPNRPAGAMVLGYDERGHCPMLVDGACSIYEHRPRTCRTYDCRVFAAAGVEVEIGQPAIAARVAGWEFAVDRERDSVLFAAVRAAAAWVRERDGNAPAIAVAVRAIEIHEQFLPAGDAATPTVE